MYCATVRRQQDDEDDDDTMTTFDFKQQIILTRLSSNLKPTTRECVHLVKRDHFRSRDKDSGHIIRSTVDENLQAARKLHRSVFYRLELPIEVLYCGSMDFGLFLLL